ncbi:hypothetical protein GCM10022205_29210 [Spinactinospora alkalitolerans]
MQNVDHGPVELDAEVARVLGEGTDVRSVVFRGVPSRVLARGVPVMTPRGRSTPPPAHFRLSA